MLTAWSVSGIALLYVAGLFGLAYFVDRRASAGRRPIDNAVVYALSLAVYCTSWTFYGSVGRAVGSGVGFLPVYLGPTLMMVLWYSVLRKTVRVARADSLTSLADFLGARYGQSGLLATIVTAIAVVGVTPYIALQLKAISHTFEALVAYPDIGVALASAESRPFYTDSAFGAALLLVLFSILFGARDLDSSKRHEGLVATIAFESVVKLLAFLVVGVFVTLGAFGGFGDIFGRIAQHPEYARLLGGGSALNYGDWAAVLLLSMLAIVLLPRQFHVAVVAGPSHETHIRTARWLFPAYLVAINIFVLPIALAGLLSFPSAAPQAADSFVLALPMLHQQQGLALLVFLGGVSAAASMVIVESIALSTMILNSLVAPRLVALGRTRDVSRLLINAKRLAIVCVVLLGYAYNSLFGEGYTLVNIGLISFAAFAQFAPAFFGGLYWRSATRVGALAGICVGFVVWCYTLIVPAVVRLGWLPQGVLFAGPFDLDLLRPEQLFGLTDVGVWANTVFWSLGLNSAAFALVSLATQPSPVEAAQAERFTGALDRDPGGATSTSTAWGTGVSAERLERLVAQFIGEDRARSVFGRFYAARGIGDSRRIGPDDRRSLLQLTERTLSGAIGATSAQVIVEGLSEADADQPETILDVFGQMSKSLEHSREELQLRVRELSLLYEASAQVASTLEPREMMDGILGVLRREFGFDLLVIHLEDRDGRLQMQSWAADEAVAPADPADPSRDDPVGLCFLDNRAITAEDAALLPDMADPGWGSFVHVPVRFEERPIGVLSAYASTAGGRVYFSPELLRLFHAIGVQLGLGLHHALVYRELHDLSRDLEVKVRHRTAELEAANRRLTELDKLKSDFVSTVSHELRTPLTSIRSLSESMLVDRELPRDTQEQALRIIAQESQRLSRIINQLLDLARIESGEVEWRMESLDLGEVAAHAVHTNRTLFEDKDIVLECHLGNGVAPIVADRDRIVQVLTNLLSNAAKFTPSGGNVRVRLVREDGRAVVEVADSGLGIPADQLDAIFERFRQVGDTLTAKPEGTGLGLPISRDIVRHHGGSLIARSEPGQGTCVRMSLPVAG
jgi:phosphoserine phosphatase RsbU/P